MGEEGKERTMIEEIKKNLVMKKKKKTERTDYFGPSMYKNISRVCQ